jgi:hypothetical protein
MKFAIDCHVSKAVQNLIVETGHVIVVRARPAETDSSWFNRGLEAGAVGFISNDNDIGDLVWNSGRKDIAWVQLRRDQVRSVERWLKKHTQPRSKEVVWTPPGPESKEKVLEANRQREAQGLRRI